MANQNTTEREFTATLVSVLNGVSSMPREDLCDLADIALDGTDSLLGMEASSFREEGVMSSNEGVMSSNEGLTVRLPNGRRFQITVVRSR
jgi:hypothetical protein